jgi:hypothetical protein
MYRDIKGIARQVRKARESSEPDIAVFLGIGASLTPGSPAAEQVLNDILLEAGVSEPDAMTDADRVSAYFGIIDEASRKKRYEVTSRFQRQARTPIGYRHLARLVADGCFRTVITTSFDTFLAEALHDEGLGANDLLILDASYDQLPDRRRQPLARLVRLRGDPFSADFLSKMDQLVLTDVLDEVLGEELAGRVIMVGYHPRDGAIDAFVEAGADPVWYVNQEEPGPENPLAPALSHRGAKVIAGEFGYADRFFGELADLLLYQGVEIQVAQSVESVEDGGSFVGVKIGKFGDSIAQVTGPRYLEESELDSVLGSGPVFSMEPDYLDEEEEGADSEALIGSLKRQRHVLKYDYHRTLKKSARYGARAPEAVQIELKSIEEEIARIDSEIESLSSEEA